MKKIILMMCLLTAPALANDAAFKVRCESAKGSTVVVAGQMYCKSDRTFNWWNARSWCDSLETGRDLIDLNDVCTEYYRLGRCDEIMVDGADYSVWARNVPNGVFAYYVKLSDGLLLSGDRGYPIGFAALCR